jgi:hypothetical protein
MGADNSKPIEEIRDTGDCGDDVQRRFRYQAVYAAQLSLKLLEQGSEFDAIFCEHHEDILVRRKDGLYIGVQVKTKQDGGMPFRATDDAIKKSLLRFAKYKKKYDGQFSKFVIASSVGFWKERENISNLEYLICQAKGPDGNKQIVARYVKQLIKKGGDQEEILTDDDLLKIMPLVEVQHTSALPDIETRLQGAISYVDSLKERPFYDLKNAADALIERTVKAGALSHEFGLRDIYKLFEKPDEIEEEAVIKGKLITKRLVEETISSACGTEIVLKTGNYVLPNRLPATMQVGCKKMVAGGVKTSNINLAKAQKNAGDYLLVKWFHQYNAEQAKNRYGQVALIVHTECQEAFSEAYRKDEAFGEEMLKKVRERLRRRYKDERDLFFDCRYEHLMGFVGTLSEDCLVWWSDKFPL